MEIVKRTCIAEASWLALNELEYKDRNGRHRKWESVSRRKSSGAVLMIAILKPSDRILLVRQYRPPAESFVIEFPAGLVEPNEEPAVAAVRELREETGYLGRVLSVSARAYNSPGLTSEYIQFVRMEVDEKTVGELKTEFDESEDIETFAVPLCSLREFVDAALAKQDSIDAKVLSFVMMQDIVNDSASLFYK